MKYGDSMKNKINVDIVVPSLNKTYNLFIPVNKTVGEIIKLINKAINELTDGEFPISNNLTLINLYTCSIYNVDSSVKNNKIENGSRLALI